MKNDNIKVFIKDEPWNLSKSLYVVRHDSPNLKPQLLIKNEWVEIKDEVDYPEPTIKLPTDVFQKIIDALSDEVKPTAKAEVDAELKATKYHLEDMRKLVKGL